ncbi:hypothetical protein DL95DRAFT_167342 [Leptodontidium sp. 2 PMI_412]|nr:hypothetical protein DL95DRAFT_167342 [Leptodontidium sp. 2 PMI_412]
MKGDGQHSNDLLPPTVVQNDNSHFLLLSILLLPSAALSILLFVYFSSIPLILQPHQSSRKEYRVQGGQFSTVHPQPQPNQRPQEEVMHAISKFSRLNPTPRFKTVWSKFPSHSDTCQVRFMLERSSRHEHVVKQWSMRKIPPPALARFPPG